MPAKRREITRKKAENKTDKNISEAENKKDENTNKIKNKSKEMSKIIYQQESYKIIGACFEVYKQKGFGFTEPIYQECLAIEFEIQQIPFVAQPEIKLEYKGRKLEQFFKPDFVCFDKIIVEIKAISDLIEVNTAQTLNYLNATKFDLALLVNFGHYPKLEYKRFANNRLNHLRKNIKDEIESWQNDY